MKTPAFLLWSLEYSCPVRGFEDGSLPHRVERQLRAARATSDAIRERRVYAGFCLDPPNGFRIDAALALYGGLPAVEGACRGCPANALAQCDSRSLAGCFGIVPLPGGIELSVVDGPLDDAFPKTNPLWYGLWIEESIPSPTAKRIARELDRLDQHWLAEPSWAELRAALTTASDAGLTIHVAHYPPGQVTGRSWNLVRHCRHCKAPWGALASRRCAVCGYEGGPAPDRKRQARGQRPYFPLDRLLGPAAARELLINYAELQAQQQSPDRLQTRLPPVPPDNPRAG